MKVASSTNLDCVIPAGNAGIQCQGWQRQEALKRRVLRSERREPSAAIGNPTPVWAEPISILCVLCVSAVQMT